ncbi:adenylate/guanylate cyclase domain-containing protein [soil metagenome]
MADQTTDGYASELRREILRSETQRMQVLAVVLMVVLTTTLAVVNLLPGFADRMFKGGLQWWVPLAAIGPFAVHELFGLFVLTRRAARDKDFPRYARFVNALIETSMPSVLIFVMSQHMEATAVFGFWPPMLYFVFILLSTLRLDFWLSLWTGLIAALQQFLLAAWLLPLEFSAPVPENSVLYNLSRSVVLLGAGIVAGIVAGRLLRQFDTSMKAAAARDRVTNMFGQHVSPAVVDRLLAQQTDPPSEMREVCVLFLDIRGFTAMTRTRPAEQTVALLNDFFAEMIDIVDRHNGIINKFLGDGFLALFGAPLPDPRSAPNALAAAHGMLEAVGRWNQARPETALRIGIGIHLGEAVTGTVGSPRRKEYTVIGDTVNLAARLEQLTKETGSQLLVSNAVQRATGGAGGATDLGSLAIRGYDEEVRVWRVV